MLFKFKDKARWAQECANRGAKNHLAEKNTYADMGQEHMLEYAVGPSNKGLFGTWHPVRKEGVIYKKPLQAFDTRNREFVKEKMKDYF